MELEGGASGSASNAESTTVLPPAPAQLEFAPPECVLGRPPAPAWDAWAAGVFLYVFLTGVSTMLLIYQNSSHFITMKTTTTKKYIFPVIAILGRVNRGDDGQYNKVRLLLPSRALGRRGASTGTDKTFVGTGARETALTG